MKLENNGVTQNLKINISPAAIDKSGLKYDNHITVQSKYPINSLALNMFNASRLDEIDAFLKNRKHIKIPTSRYEKIKTYLHSTLDFIGKETEKSKRQEAEFSMALGDLYQFKAISRNYLHLDTIPQHLFRAFFKDDLVPENEESSARNYLFEYYIGARFKAAKCEVFQQEPDFVCEFEGERFGVAAKRLKIKNLREHISKAGKQLKNQGLIGVLAVDLSQNIFDKKLFKGTEDQCRKITHEWMHINFSEKIRERKDWGIYKKNIRTIIAFIIIGYYDTEKRTPATFSHFTAMRINRPPGKYSDEEIESDEKTKAAIEIAIANMRIIDPSID